MAKLHFLKSISDSINTSFILQSGDALLVVDGGYACEAPYMYEYLKALGGHVTAWFITHLHNDHVSCLHEILSGHSDITVDAIYRNFPSDAFIIQNEPMQRTVTSEELLRRFREDAVNRGVEVVTVQAGEKYSFDGGNVVVRVLRTPDESITENPINNSSVVYRFEADEKSILFLGDLAVKGGEQLLSTVDPSLIKADYVQMAHHGQKGVSKECYEAIRPSYCLWPTPSWLWNNIDKNGGVYYDTGNYDTIVTRGWISAMHCVRRHYLMIDGTQVIDLNNDDLTGNQ